MVVQNDVNRLVLRQLGLDRVEEMDELLMPVALRVAADDGAIENIQGGEKCRGAVALVIMGHRAGTVLLHGRAGWVRSSAWIWLFSSTERTIAWAGGET